MADYAVEMPHSTDNCMEALEAMMKDSPKLLENTWWGCMAGNHAGWAIMEASNESEVRDMIPEQFRAQTKITEVQKLTPDQIKSMHSMAA